MHLRLQGPYSDEARQYRVQIRCQSCARSNVGRHDGADRWVGLHGADLAAGYLDPDWVLHRAVGRIGLAVSAGCAGETSRGRGDGGLTRAQDWTSG